jgi:hypothetical protein
VHESYCSGPYFFFFVAVEFGVAAFMPVSIFIFIAVSFFMPVSAAAGAMAGGVALDVESVMVELVSFVLQAATANRAATTTRRFIYDLLGRGGGTSARYC